MFWEVVHGYVEKMVIPIPLEKVETYSLPTWPELVPICLICSFYKNAILISEPSIQRRFSNCKLASQNDETMSGELEKYWNLGL